MTTEAIVRSKHNQNKIKRELKDTWLDLEQLSEITFLSTGQITAIMAIMRTKGVALISRPHKTKRRYKEYSLSSDPNWSQGTEGGHLGVGHLNKMMIAEFNKIVNLCEEGNTGVEIKRIALRALSEYV